MVTKLNIKECGIANYSSNLKIIGGTVAIPNSWPSVVYVQFSFAGNFYLKEYNTTTYQTINTTCGGTLIDRSTILTAAHCLPKTFSFKYGVYRYTASITPNSIYPTYASMFKVYLGVQDISKLNIFPVVKMDISNVILVREFN